MIKYIVAFIVAITGLVNALAADLVAVAKPAASAASSPAKKVETKKVEPIATAPGKPASTPVQPKN